MQLHLHIRSHRSRARGQQPLTPQPPPLLPPRQPCWWTAVRAQHTTALAAA